MRRFNACFRFGLGLFLILGLAGAPSAAMDLNGVTFPEGRSVNVYMEALPGASEGRIDAEVTHRAGQSKITMSYQRLKPAILFAGDVTCYVMWAVTRDGESENLGEFLVDEPKGRMEFATGKKSFALIVTAEPFYLVSRPSSLVMYRNLPSRDKKAPSTAFAFDGLVAAPNHAMDSIANIAWDSKIPLTLLQARKAHELALRNDAEKHAPRIVAEAGTVLAQANDVARKSPSSRKVLDDAGRAVALSNEALNISLRRKEGIEIEKQIAARRAEMNGLEQRARESEQQARDAAERAKDAESTVTAARADMAKLRTDRDRMTSQTEALRQEKAGLESAMTGLRAEKQALLQEKTNLSVRLESALSHVAETRSSARGFVVNLPDILFDVNEATLKNEARLVLAKMAGILLVIPDLQVRVEGHTDSTGSAEYNRDLSQRRAESVSEFMSGEGVSSERLAAVGFGMDQPVADNATSAGRSKNRRVEIVISEGKSPS